MNLVGEAQMSISVLVKQNIISFTSYIPIIWCITHPETSLINHFNEKYDWI